MIASPTVPETVATQDGVTVSESSYRPFAWYGKDLHELAETIGLLADYFGDAKSPVPWKRTEALEEKAAVLILRLGLVPYFNQHVVPVRRRYELADGHLMSGIMADGRDARDLAVRVQFTLATPRAEVCSIRAAMSAAREHDGDPDVPVKRTRRNPIDLSRYSPDTPFRRFMSGESFTRAFNLFSLKKKDVRSVFQRVLAEWKALIAREAEAWRGPPDIRTHRIAAQLEALAREIETHRHLLVECESGLEEHGAFGDFPPRDAERNLAGAAGELWRSMAYAIQGSHERALRHCIELEESAQGVSRDLEFGLGKKAGPTESALRKMLAVLREHFEFKARNPFASGARLMCGYDDWHFRGLHSNFREWWSPLFQRAHRLAKTFRSAALRNASSGDKGNSARVRGSQGRKRGKPRSDGPHDQKVIADWSKQRSSFSNSPTKFARARANLLKLPSSTVERIVKKHLQREKRKPRERES